MAQMSLANGRFTILWGPNVCWNPPELCPVPVIGALVSEVHCMYYAMQLSVPSLSLLPRRKEGGKEEGERVENEYPPTRS